MKLPSRRALAAIICGTLAGVGAYVPTPAHAAAGPSEITVVPADASATYQTDRIEFAGATGFLHQRALSAPWLWTRYSDGVTTVVDELAGVLSGRIISAGGDRVALTWALPDHPFDSTTRPVVDLDTMTWQQAHYSAGSETRVFGDMLMFRPTGNANVPRLRPLDAGSDDPGKPVTGIPADATSISIGAGMGDADAAVLGIIGPGYTRYGLVDLRTARLALLPAGTASATRVVLSAGSVGLLTPLGARIFSRAAIMDGTVTGPEKTFAFPASGTVTAMGLVDDDLIVAPTTSKTPALRYSATGVAPTQVAPLAETTALQAPDGVVFVGGSGLDDWAVRKATGSSVRPVLSLSAPLVNAGVTLSSGVLRHIQARTIGGKVPEYLLYNHQLSPGTDLPVPSAAGPLAKPVDCEQGAICVRSVDGMYYGTSYISSGTSSISVVAGSSTKTLPSKSGTIVDASRDYQLVAGHDQDQLYILKRGTTAQTAVPKTGAGLWFDLLWSATGAGTLTPKNLLSSTTGPAVATGAGCTATEVQATAKHLYWTCGATGPAGVYDLTRKTNIPVPAGQYLLGDNYLVRHDNGGDLLRYDLTDGTLGDAVKLATRPRGELADDRNITWAVDKFGGHVAWVDGENAVHIVDSGVPASPAARSTSFSGAGPTFELAQSTSWGLTEFLTRPIDSSVLTVTQVRTGRVVAGVTGGPARTTVGADWNGVVDGKRATSGNYRWTFSATAGGTTGTVSSGTIAVTCGTPTLHSYSCDGQPTLVRMLASPAGTGQWLTTQPGSTALQYNGFQETWEQLTGIIAFGDISKDYYNDLLIRRSDGTMRVYLGNGSANFGSSTSIAVAGNWNSFNVLLHTGDVTGDGQADLITRNRDTGSLYIYPGNGKGGFNTAVQIAGGYKGYTAFVGSGDISGDGKADLLLRYNNNLYGFYGAGDGTFTAGLHLISAGWDAYSTIIGAGDLNEDGKNDLLARDTAGVVYRMLGNGTGGFGSRQQVATGYQAYTGPY